jgi:hypothetical protein
MSDATTTIYEPPKEGLPYLVVTFTSDGMNVSTAKSSAAARTMASDRSITQRRRRLSVQSKVSELRRYDDDHKKSNGTTTTAIG